MNTVQHKRIRPISTWRLLSTPCARRGCQYHAPMWQGFFGRDDGIICNDQWFCSAECFEAAAAEQFFTLAFQAMNVRRARPTRMPLGLHLLSRDIISEEQLSAALQLHRTSELPMGQCLLRLGAIDTAQLTSAIAAQWACPVFSASSFQPGVASLLPRLVRERYRVSPVHFTSSSQCLFVGFTSAVDYRVLQSIEYMLNCTTEPCILSDESFENYFTRCDPAPEVCDNSISEVVFERSLPPEEMSRIASSYSEQVRASDVRFSACADFIWTRVHGRRTSVHLLFARSSSGTPKVPASTLR